MVICAVIGSGVFLVPGVVLRQMDGSIILAMLVWFGGGILSLLGGLAYGELSAARPEAGGLYVYIRDCFGPLPAFLYGWTLYFMSGSGAAATLAVAFSAYLGEVIPLTPALAKIVSILVIAIVTIVNVRGVRQSADVQNWTTAIKGGAILLMSIIFLVLGDGFTKITPEHLWSPRSGLSIFSAFGIAMISVLWAYEGWQFVTFNAAEVVEPQRNFPRAFLVGLMALIGLYLFANIGYLAALRPEQAAATDTIAATSFQAVIGPAAAKLISLAILVSMFSAANTIFLTTPRVFYAMAADGLFFQKLASVHPRFRTPAFAVIALSIWSVILSATGTFQQLLTYVIFTSWIFYSLAAACVFIYRKRHPHASLPYHTPGYPWTVALFVLSGAALVLNAVIADTRNSIIGLLIVLTGVPAYFVWRNRKRASQLTMKGGINLDRL
jgi:APA family basic amino acid/polyamine antiporter